MDIYQKLDELLSKQVKRKKFDSSKVTPDTNLMDLGLDSLDMAELVINIEEEFNLPEISQEEMIGLKTVKDVVSLIEAKSAK